MFTQEQINEIKQRLSLSGIKDSELDKLNLLEHPLTGKEVITIVKDGKNLRISVEDLYEEFAKYIEQSENKEDFFNISVYLGRLDPEFENAAKPCTLEEAINACPSYIRRAGQVIVFLDSVDNMWKSYQMTGSNDSDWEDINLFSPYNLLDYIDENPGLTPGAEGYIEDSREKGVTQRLLQAWVYNLRSEAKSSEERLQDQIDAIVSDKAIISLSASDTIFIVGKRVFTLTASTNTSAKSIVIKQGSNTIATGSGKTLIQEVSVEQATVGNISYIAEFIFAGDNKRTTNATVYFVNKIYVGSGAVYTDVTTDAHAVSARKSPAGTYTVTVAENGQYVFFVIPATMSITKATLSGFDFPLESPISETIDNVSYKVYRSSNTNDAGTYQIVIS